MTARTTLRAMVIAIAAILLAAPPVLADTCCANVPVELDPGTANPGDVVRLIGMECRSADNSGPNPLNLGRFWLATTDRPAEVAPDVTPGEGPPDFPPVEDWFPFDSVAPGAAGVAAPGDATITVPDLPNERYQVWWWCDDGSGPGGGIHYSTGPSLTIGTVPDTATEAPSVNAGDDGPVLSAGLAIALGIVTLAGLLRHPSHRTRRRAD